VCLAGALAWLLLAPAPASAQAVANLLGALRGDSAAASPVEPEAEQQAIRTAKTSFEHAADALVRRIVTATAPSHRPAEQVVDQRIAEASEDFSARVQEGLMSDKGDGVLTRAELSTTLANARADRLDALEEALHAAVAGAAPPPARTDFDDWGAYAQAITVYTLAERNEAWRWGLAAGLLIVGLVVAGLLARALGVVAGRLSDGRGRLAARAASSLSGPLYLAGSVVALRAAVDWVWLPVGARDAIGVGTGALLALSLLWVVWNAASGLVDLLDKAASRTRGRMDDDVVGLLRKAVRIAALALFAVFVVDAFVGVELTSILAGVGILGIIVSIAAQDTLRNLMGSFTIYGDRPFAEGDLIRLKGHLGNVEEIGFRSTRVRRLDGHRVTVPNAEVVRESVENLSVRPYVRHHYGVDIVYATSPDRVQRAVEILEEILEEAKPPPDRPPRVSFEEFAPHSLRLMVWYYSDTSDYWEARRQRTEINRQILRRFREEGLEFAFPTRSVYLMQEADGLTEGNSSDEESEAGEGEHE
jgi:small-conductance mechanosensitive channel